MRSWSKNKNVEFKCSDVAGARLTLLLLQHRALRNRVAVPRLIVFSLKINRVIRKGYCKLKRAYFTYHYEQFLLWTNPKSRR